MNAREKLDEFAEINGMNKNQLIGWSIAADFAEWYVEQVKNCSTPDVVGRSEQLCDHEWLNHSFDHFGFLQEQICDKCGAKQSVS
jgi:hypothetical protein